MEANTANGGGRLGCHDTLKRPKRPSIVAFAIGCLLAATAGYVEVAAQPSRTLSQKFDSIATENLAQDRAVGAVVAVVRGNDTLFFRSYGKMDVASDEPMTTDAIFGVGSITKQFTAAAILKLRDEGKLSLEDDLTKWLPDFDTHGHEVSLRRLLDHTSGIHDLTETRKFRELVWSKSFPRDSIYALIKRYPFQFPPGTAQVYNNSAYWLLHLVIEKASGMSYQRYIESRLFEPIGMTDSGFCLSSEHIPRRATGYHVRKGRVRRAPLNVSTWYLGSGVFCSTAGDLITWLKALHDGRVLSPASYAEMIKPATLSDGTQTRYAMGLQVGADIRGLDVIGHSGELPGYGARANWYPDAQMAVVVLINNSGDVSASAMAEDLAAEVLPVTRRVRRAFGRDAAPLVGTYRGPARGGDMVVVVKESSPGITVSINGTPARPLSWVEGLTFQQGAARLTFGRTNGLRGPATELRYAAENGYYILERLTLPEAMLAQTRLLIERQWPVVLLGLGGLAFMAGFAVFLWSRAGKRSERLPQ